MTVAERWKAYELHPDQKPLNFTGNEPLSDESDDGSGAGPAAVEDGGGDAPDVATDAGMLKSTASRWRYHD